MLQVRISDEIKNKASKMFDALGIDLSTAVRIFLIKSIAVGGLPFEMNDSTNKALEALQRMGQKSKELGNDKLTLDEINEIIAEVRKEYCEEKDIILNNNCKKTDVEKLANVIASTGGNGEISPKNQRIIHLYTTGDIDYETAVFAIKRNFKKGN